MPVSASVPSTTIGGRPLFVAMRARIRVSGSATRSIGRALSDSSPLSSKRPCWPARMPVRRRISVPALPQSIGAPGGRSPRSPAPWTRSSSSAGSSTCTPSVRTAAIVDSVSAERPNPRTRVSPSHSAPIRTARCEIDLSPGTAMCPTSAPAGSTLLTLASHPRHGVRHRDVAERGSFAEDGRRDHVVALRLEDGGRARSFVFVSDEEGERSAALAGHVLQLEVLDVDPLRAERLRDAGKNARAVGNVDAQTLKGARLLVRLREHAAPVPRRLRDPAGEEARVSLPQRALELLDEAPAWFRRTFASACGR